jgi:hypothetical protein
MQSATQTPSHFNLPIHNRDALAQLRREKDILSNGAMAVGGTALLSGVFGNPTAFLFLLGVYPPLIRGTKAVRLEKITALLLESFEEQGVQVFPVQGVDRFQGVSENNPIDLFVRFPKRTHLFISIRSKGDREVVYNESREILQVRKKGKAGLTTWNPCPLLELAGYEKWLDKNRALFGMSSREAQKTPAAKVLILWPPTKAVENHNQNLYSEVGDMKILALRRKGTTFVIQEEEVLNFVQAWLAKYD